MSDLPQLPSPAEAEAILARWDEARRADWERCRGWLEDALIHDGGFYSIKDIAEYVERGEAHLWAGEHSAAVTQWWFFPKDKVLNLWLAGGDLAELVERMFPAAEVWAAERGATRIMLAGRPGWQRVFAPKGFKVLSTLLIKEIAQ